MQNNKILKLNAHVTAFELDEPMFRLKCAIDCVDAVHTAMTDAPYSPEDLLDAMYGAVCGLYDAYAGLRDLIYLEDDVP